METKPTTALEWFYKSLYQRDFKEAICEYVPGADSKRCTYKELAVRSDSLARSFINQGLIHTRQIALIARPSVNSIITAFAVIKSSAVLMLIDTQFDNSSLMYVLSDGSPALICADPDILDRLTKLLTPNLPPLLDLEKIESGFEFTGELPQINPDRNALLFYTSGTTGFPKGVPLTINNISFELQTLAKLRILKPDDKVLLPLPIHHVYPFVIGILTPLYMGLTLIIPASLNGPDLINAIHTEKVSVIIGVPKFYRALYDSIAYQIAKSKLYFILHFLILLRKHAGIRLGSLLLHSLHNRFGSRLRVLACGGASLAPDLFTGLEAIGWKVAIGYGLTETSPIVTLSEPGKSRPGSAGYPIKGVEIRIDTSNTLGNNTGEIQVRGPNVFNGYLHNQVETNKSFTKDGWFKTGDLGYFDNKGHLYIIDRLSSVIVTENGENITPEEVEAVYEKHPSLQEAGVFQYEGKLVALIVPDLKAIAKEGFGIEEGVHIAIEEQSRLLPSYKRITGFFVTLKELPRTRLGKIKRHLLLNIYLQKKEESEKTHHGTIPLDSISDSDRQLLQNAAASQVWEIFVKRFSDHLLTPDSLLRLDLGIDSLTWLELTLEIHDITGIEINEKDIAQITTVRDLLLKVAQKSTYSGSESADPFFHPEKHLSPDQLKWLEPLNRPHKLYRYLLYHINKTFHRIYFHLTVDGLENVLSARQCIITPNHVSFIDSFVMAAALPYHFLLHTVWAAGVEVAFKNKLNIFVSRLAGAIPIEHGLGARSDMALAAAAIDKGNSIIWYPEGRRAPGNNFLPFRSGIGLLLQKRKLDVVPVIIQGTEKAMPIGTIIPRPVHIRITFGKALTINDLLDKSSEQPKTEYQRIASGLQNVMERMRDQVV